jgi:hypothetical protein
MRNKKPAAKAEAPACGPGLPDRGADLDLDLRPQLDNPIGGDAEENHSAGGAA